jgi:hypothetical protein
MYVKSTCKSLVENPPFLIKSFQLHDTYNYVSTRIFYFKNRIMEITNLIDLFAILVYSWKHFSIGWSFVEYSQHQQCLQVEHPIILVNNVKLVSTKGPFSNFLASKVI